MDIKFLGGAGEVGGNAFLVKEKSKIMLDYGVRIHPEPPTYPMPARVDAAILSHSHLDHCGGLAALYRKNAMPTFMTDISMELMIMLLKDSLKIAKKEKYPTPFNEKDIKGLISNVETIDYNQKTKFREFNITLMDAGHIPGSAGVLLETEGKRIFYTGDVNTKDTRLLTKCQLPRDIDVLILESTYADRKHTLRSREEAKLVAAVEEALANNTTALIPAFAIGRSQEVLMILEKYADKIALDGMAKQATEIALHNPKYIKDADVLKRVLKKVFWIDNHEDRKMALKEMSIIVATAGMLSGGPALYYLKEISKEPESKVLFSGFLVEDSPGRILLDTGHYQGDEMGKPVSYGVECDIRRFDFSSHAGRDGLLKIIQRTNPSKVISIHGDNTPKFAKEIERMFGIKAFAPKKGETIKL